MNADRIQSLLQRGLEFHRNRQLVEAEACYREVLGIDPNNADAIHLLGLLADAIGDKDLAVDLIARALSIQPSSDLYCASLARILKSQGKMAQAIAYFQEAIKLAPDREDFHMDLGALYQEVGRIEDAVSCYRKCLALAPHDANCRTRLAEALRDSLATTAESPGNAIAELLQRGQQFHRDGRFNEAKHCYAEALIMDSADTLAADLIELANDALEDARLVEEILHIPDLTGSNAQESPPSIKVSQQLADTKLDYLEKRNEALWLQEQLLIVNAELDAFLKSGTKWNFSTALSNARTHLKNGRLMEAKGIAELILRLQAENREATIFLVELGVLFHQRRDLATSEKIYRRLLEANPSNIDALHLLGLIHSQRHQYDKAFALIERSLQSKTPAPPHFYKNAGQIAEKLHDPVKAEAYLRKAISLNRTYAEGHASLAQLLIRQKRFDEAEQCLKEAIALIPDSKEIADQLHFLNYKARPLPRKAH
jgi:tetratricopeptide (TPR) repeat protein